MLTCTLLAPVAALVATTAAAAFSPTAKNNVAIYWGQGPYQDRLVETCKNSNVDIINIAFINVFPDQGAAGYPGSNFGNACEAGVYTNGGKKTQLLKNCKYIGPDIKTCQKTYGKKILLSLGGGYPINQYLVSDTSAKNFATFLWGAFGPQTSAWVKARKPRPFGTASVDGFDFDIESEISPAPTYKGKQLNDYKTRGYGKMISTFRQTLFKKDKSKKYYISAAPQCLVPDSHYGALVQKYWFDFLFVQFYNTPQCSARAGIEHIRGSNANDISFAQWSKIKFYNKNVRVYLGVPANTNASGLASYYLQPSELQTLVKKFYGNAKFGGIMLWEATYARNNVICGSNYAVWAKKILNAKKNGQSLLAPSANSQCNKKRDIQGTADVAKRQVVSPSAPALPPTSSLSVAPVVETSAPAPAPASSPSTDAVAPSSVEPAAELYPAIDTSSPSSSVAVTAEVTSAVDTSAPSPVVAAAEPVIISSQSTPIVETSTSSTSDTVASQAYVAADNTQVNAEAAATDTTSPTVASPEPSVSNTTAVSNVNQINATISGNITQAAAQTATDLSSGAQAASTISTNSTGTAQARVQAASVKATVVVNTGSATELATTSKVNGTIYSVATTADAVDVTAAPASISSGSDADVTPALKAANGTSGAEATAFVTKTITNVVYETMSTCAPTITDCSDHPESQTVFVVTSTVNVYTTVYISGNPAPTPKTLYSDIYNTVSVFYASTSATAGLDVNANLYNPHADEETTTITTQRTTTIFSTSTLHASRSTTTLTSTLTVWPKASGDVAAAKLAVPASSSDEPASTKAASSGAKGDSQTTAAPVSEPTPSPSAPAANNEVEVQNKASDAKAPSAQNDNEEAAPAPAPGAAIKANKAASPAISKPFAIPANGTAPHLKIAAPGAVGGNTNATGYRASGLDPAKAFGVQAKAAQQNATGATSAATRRIVPSGSGLAAWLSAIVGSAIFFAVL